MESTRLIFADSRNRDVTLYPSGNSYTLHLTTPIKNVTRVELISARVPNTMYNLTNGSSVLTINSTDTSLNQGFYSAGGISSALTTAVNSVFTMNYLSDEGRFILSSIASFNFSINSSELSELVGIPQGTTFTSTLATSLDPFYASKFIFKSNTMIHMNANEYIFLDIDELKTPSHIDAKALVGASGTVSGSNINRAFAPIMMDTSSGGMKIYSESSDYTVSVSYPEPINSLQRLTVRWYDANGSLLNFRGSDYHAFILRAHVLEEDPRRLPPPSPLQDVGIKRMWRQ